MFCVTYDLARGSCPGVLPPGPTTFEFDFDVEKEEESYYGSHVQIEFVFVYFRLFCLFVCLFVCLFFCWSVVLLFCCFFLLCLQIHLNRSIRNQMANI